MWVALCSSDGGGWLWIRDEDPMDNVAVIDEVFTFPRRRAENFFRMEESGGGLGIDVGGGVDGVGVLERDFPRERTMGLDDR